MKLTEYSVADFLDETASASPAPGGGSVSALAGALAAALASMVANLSQGKNFSSVVSEMQEIAARAKDLQKNLEDAIQKDTDSFGAYLDALKLPKGTQEQMQARANAMQRALQYAAGIPLETAKTAVQVFPLLHKLLQCGNKNAESDALVAAMLAKVAVYGAAANVRINLKGIQDDSFRLQTERTIEELVQCAKNEERSILKCSAFSFGFA